MTESLKDKIKKAKEKAAADQKSKGGGDLNRWKPGAGEDHLFRILPRLDAPEPWVMGDVHYIDTGDGTAMLGCGSEECYSCNEKIKPLSESGSKEDQKRARRSRKQTKIMLGVVDWRDRKKGPLVWEPKNTQSCSQWLNILGLIDNADFGPDIYKAKEGRLITMSMTSAKKKIEGKPQDVLSLRTMQCGTKPCPVVIGKTKSGFAIQLTLKDGAKKVFPLMDLSALLPDYDENAHRAAWGEEVIEEEVEEVEDEEASDDDFEDLTADEKPAKKKKKAKPVEEEEEEETEEEEEEEPAPPKKKKKRPAPVEEEEEEEQEEFEEEEEEEPAPPKKKKKKPAPVEEEEEEEELEEEEEEEEEPEPPKKKKKKPVPPPEEEEEEELEEDFEFTEEDEEEPPKKVKKPIKKGTK